MKKILWWVADNVFELLCRLFDDEDGYEDDYPTGVER